MKKNITENQFKLFNEALEKAGRPQVTLEQAEDFKKVYEGKEFEHALVRSNDCWMCDHLLSRRTFRKLLNDEWDIIEHSVQLYLSI